MGQVFLRPGTEGRPESLKGTFFAIEEKRILTRLIPPAKASGFPPITTERILFMNNEVLMNAYTGIVRNYLRDDAVFDKFMQQKYPDEYKTTMASYEYINYYMKTRIFPALMEQGGIKIENGVDFKGTIYKFLDKLNRKEFDSIYDRVTKDGTSFWEHLPDLSECTKELEQVLDNELEIEPDAECDEYEYD